MRDATGRMLNVGQEVLLLTVTRSGRISRINAKVSKINDVMVTAEFIGDKWNKDKCEWEQAMVKRCRMPYHTVILK